MSGKSSCKGRAQTKAYVPEGSERAAIDAVHARTAARPPSPGFKLDLTPGNVRVTPDHPDETVAFTLQTNALGLTTAEEYKAVLTEMIRLTHKEGAGEANEAALNQALAMAVGIGPTNTVEAMLAVQMVAVHQATVAAAIRAKNTTTLEFGQLHQKTFNNLSRTFAIQAETLKKLRSSGEQKVIVEHKHYHLAPGAIADGAQAVLGDVTGVAGGKSENRSQSHGKDGLLLPERAAVLSEIETHGLPVPSSGGDGKERLPVSWSQGGRA